MADTSSSRPKHRGIYIIPNLFTLGALFSGFYAIVAATNRHFDTAAIAIFLGMILDSLDGRIARLTHTQSEFGAQMDSLSDMVCFGVSPALVLFVWSLRYYGNAGWLVAFFYTVCTALRLARFNAQVDSSGKRYFQGLPTPAAAGVVAGMIWVSTQYGVLGQQIGWLVGIVTIALGILKVSTVPYRSFKDIDLRNKVPFLAIFLIVLIFVLISFDPPDVLLTIFVAYVLSGPWILLFGRAKYRRARRAQQSKSDDEK